MAYGKPFYLDPTATQEAKPFYLDPTATQKPTKARTIEEQVYEEKVAEETQYRKEFEEQLTTAEAEARAEYERDLETKIAAARAKYEAELVAGKELSRAEIETKIRELATSERVKFEASLATQKAALKKTYLARVKKTRAAFQKLLGLRVREAKREYVIQYRQQFTPRQIRKYRETEQLMLKEALLAEQEVYGEEVKAWEKKAKKEFEAELKVWKTEELTGWEKGIPTWESKEREKLEKGLAVAEAEAKVGFEAEIKEWKKTERAEKLEPALAEWSEAWQPKGVAERMLEWKAPDLPAVHISLLAIPVAGGVFQIGVDLGKFAEGLMEGTVAAAAGITASAESLVYGVAGLAGIPTPRPPPTVTGGLITTGIQAITTGEVKPSPQLEELGRKPYAFTYAASTILGDLLLGYGIGKVAEKGVSVISKAVAPTRVGRYVAPKLAKVVRPIARVQAKVAKVAEPVTKRMVKAAEYIVSPLYKVKALKAISIKKWFIPRKGMLPMDVIPEEELTHIRAAAKVPPITAAEKWTMRAAEQIFPEGKPLMQIRYGAAWGDLPSAKDIARAAKVTVTPTEKWTLRAAQQIFPEGKPLMQIRYGAAWGDVPAEEVGKAFQVYTPAEKWTWRVGEQIFPEGKRISQISLAQVWGEKPAKEIARVARVPSIIAQKKWVVRGLETQLKGLMPTTAEDIMELPKAFKEYVKPLKPPTAKPEGIVQQAGRQVLVLEKPLLVKPLVAPKVRVTKWVIKAQEEALRLAKVTVKVRRAAWAIQAQKSLLKVAPEVLKVAPVAKEVAAPLVAVSLASVIGLKALAKPAVKPKVKVTLKPIMALDEALGLKEAVAVKPKVALAQVPAVAAAVAPALKVAQITVQAPILQLKQELRQLELLRRKEEKERLRKRKKRELDLWGKAGALFEYPVRKEEEVPSFLVKGLPKQTTRGKAKMDIGGYILGSNGRRRKR